jgi:hypothetical protein
MREKWDLCFVILYSHYDIQETGPVQEIHYVSDTETGTLRLVHSTEDEADRYGQYAT